VPILGDLSARHARIRRDNEGYLIEALREVKLDGRRVQQAALLSDGVKIQLGDGVRLLFRRPLALSATARLDFLSRHRTHPSSDAVLLMADACMLGPKSHSHVVCRDWPCEVILYRQEGELFCRTAGTFEIDGLKHHERGRIHPNARIVGERFSFSLEAI
jgi:pSer/pThr/pTyr-binding forkhead associated (FHA) protein